MTKTRLSELVEVRQRFLRSANVERDDVGDSITGYVPTTRAFDVIGRVARSMSDSTAGRAISITGPYGSGKSSLALFLEALLGPDNDAATTKAFNILREVAPSLARSVGR